MTLLTRHPWYAAPNSVRYNVDILNTTNIKHTVKYLTLLSVIFFISAKALCITPSQKTVSSKSNENADIDIKLVNIDITKVTFSSLELKVELDVLNPNDYALTVLSLTYSLKVEDTLIMSDQQKAHEKFPAKHTRRISVPVSLSYDQNISKILGLLNLRSEINYSIFGEVTLENYAKPRHFIHNDRIIPSNYIHGANNWNRKSNKLKNQIRNVK